MKKTTTRLATIAAVMIMSAFAIVLAQVDARKRDRSSEPQPLIYSGEAQESPLQIDPAWPDQTPIVRASREQLKDQLVAVAWKEDSSQKNEQSQVASAEGNFELDFELNDDQDNDLWSSLDSDVVPVSGETSSAPGWLSSDSSLPAAFPSLPPSSLPTSSLPASNLPAVPSPGTDLPASSLPEMAQPAAALPGAPFAPSSDSAGQASLPALPQPVGIPRSDSSLPLNSESQSQFAPQSQFPSQSQFSPQSQFPSQAPLAEPRSEGPTASRAQTSSFPSGQRAEPGLTQPSGPRAALVSNQPGSRFLDGSQNPIMQIQKRAPEEIQVGKKATFVITVRNAGSATAHDVTVVDRVPRGSRFAESLPAVSPVDDGTLVWNLGEMAAGDERTISLQIIPEVEGEVGSVASVHFAAQASVRTVATLPQLSLHVESAGSAIIGQAQQIVVNIQNTGSGVARGVRLEADIPGQLRHESGEAQLEALVGDLRPGESRQLTLNVAAVEAGQSQCLFRALNDDGIQTERTTSVDVRAPQLAASISGPSLRYLERQAHYQITVANTGTAMARNLDFVVHLPVGLKFISVDIPQAAYNPQSHSINLGLAELDAGQSAPFSVTVLPVQAGSQIIRLNANADLGVTAEAKTQVTVAGLAELAFTIGQDNATVEVGASTTYAVQITNVGNQPDKNVMLQVQLPEGSKLLQVDSPVDHRVEGQRILFAPLAEIRSRDVQTFRLQVQHNRAGNQVIRSQLTSENRPVAVVKEEGTLVYDDRN